MPPQMVFGWGPFAGPFAAEIAIVCPGTPLVPGQTTTCQAHVPYVVTDADAANGAVGHRAGKARRDRCMEFRPYQITKGTSVMMMFFMLILRLICTPGPIFFE